MGKKKTVVEKFLKRAKEQNNYERVFRNGKYHGNLQTWNELNRKAENAWHDGKMVEFIGADMTEDHKMICCFQIINRDGTRGGILCVDNDVTFRFQQDGYEPIERAENERKTS